MAISFAKAFQSANIVTTYPAWSKAATPGPAGSMAMVKGAAQAPPSSMELVVSTPAVNVTDTPHTTTLVETGVHRRSHDPYGDFNFVVEIDGLSAGAFQKCDGLNFEVDMIEYQHGMDPYPRKRRGVVKWGNIKLTKGYTCNEELWNWCQEIMQGKMGRRTGAIHLLADDNDSSSPVMTYKWINGFPVKWTGFKFDSGSSSPLLEEIEFCVEEVMKG